MAKNTTPTTPPTEAEKQKAIRDAVRLIAESYTKIQLEKDAIKDILNATGDNFDIPKNILHKVAVLFHRQNIAEFDSQNQEIKTLYQAASKSA